MIQHDKCEAFEARIRELEKELELANNQIAYLEECLDDYGFDRVPLREKLDTAINSLKGIALYAHETGQCGIRINANEALDRLNQNNSQPRP